MNYREKAEKCIEFTALPEMRRQFEECGCSLDAQYAKYGDTPYFHGEVVEPGHVYIVGYPCCVCPEAADIFSMLFSFKRRSSRFAGR